MIIVEGQCGIGDNIHQRAILRELMKKDAVTLNAPYLAMYHDLVKQGLKINLRPFFYTRFLESDLSDAPVGGARPGPGKIMISTFSEQIIAHGSILGAQFASAGIPMPEKPDFSLPIPKWWLDNLSHYPETRDLKDKTLLIYRPPVINQVWTMANRLPDVDAYAELYTHLRRRFFTISIANLGPQEQIVGAEQDADVKFHHGELTFTMLAALFRNAACVFSCSGFAPVLAQSVGTPTIVVYGGYEAFQTTQRTGAHLAPTLAIEPDQPCECHDHHHACDRTIACAPALGKIENFLAEYVH